VVGFRSTKSFLPPLYKQRAGFGHTAACWCSSGWVSCFHFNLAQFNAVTA
jgi:hypothetical protein